MRVEVRLASTDRPVLPLPTLTGDTDLFERFGDDRPATDPRRFDRQPDAGDIATLAIASPGFAESEPNYMNLPIVEPWRVRDAVAELLDRLAVGAVPTESAEEECG